MSWTDGPALGLPISNLTATRTLHCGNITDGQLYL